MPKKEELNVLLVGRGGRESALAWKLAQSERLGELHIVPNNNRVVEYAKHSRNSIDLAIIGPDDALVRGVVDDLTEVGIPAFGPTKNAARIESSKPYAKRLMEDSSIPTAPFEIFTDPRQAHEYVDSARLPLYAKAGGLALGKGARPCETATDAHRAVEDIMVKKIFGDAGQEMLFEEVLEGQEISLHALCDDITCQMFPSSQDHKQVYDGDKGPNTGGMGTIAPVPWYGERQVALAGQKVVIPILGAMSEEGNNFNGILYPGLMITEDGPKVIEYNARFGDPETQVYMRLLESDLLETIVAALTHNLDKLELKWRVGHAVCVVAASEGYPGEYETGKVISGLERASNRSGVEIFHAGTRKEDGTFYTDGGRVLGVTAVGGTLREAQDRAYSAIDEIRFDNKHPHYRKDIGDRPNNM